MSDGGFGYPISNAWRGEERRRAIVRELHTTHAFLGRRRRRRNTRSNYQKEGKKKDPEFSLMGGRRIHFLVERV